MSLIPVTDLQASEKAFHTLEKRLREDCQKFTRRIGWQGGNSEDVVYWNPRERFWFTLLVEPGGKRFWCPYGTVDPHSRRILGIVVECNPPIKGIDHRCAGAFLTDGTKTYLAHSGKIGGGRKGVGKTAFVNSYPHGNWRSVQWPDGRRSEMIIIGHVNGRRLPAQIGEFIREVEKFKTTAHIDSEQFSEPVVDSGFSPEFAGKRKSYQISGDIESSCDHGLVVNELAKCLERIGLKRIGKDRARDLFILTTTGKLRVLFEAKADVTTSSVYQGIGQLVYHSANDREGLRRVLVLPEIPNAKTRAVLAKIGIEVLTYCWKGSRPVFKNLKALLK